MSRITKFVLSRPLVVLLALLVITGAALFELRNLKFDISIFSIFDADSPEFVEMSELLEIFGDEAPSQVVIGFATDDVFTQEGLELVERVTVELEALEGIRSVVSLTRVPDFSSPEGLVGGMRLIEEIPDDPAGFARIRELAITNPLYRDQLVSVDGKATAVAAELPSIDIREERGEDLRTPMINEIRQLVIELERETGVKFYLSGVPVVGDEYGRMVRHDMRTFSLLCCVLIAGVLLWIYRSARGVVIPVITVLGAAVWTVGVMSFLDLSVNMINSILPALVMVIGCADSIHIMGRYTEDLGSGLNREEALSRTFRHIGVAVLLTSVTSSIGFLSLSTSGSGAVAELGQLSAAGIVFAYVFSMTFIPSMLVLINADPSRPRTERGPDVFDRFLEVVINVDLNHPRAVLLSGALVLTASLSGAYFLQTDSRALQEMNPKSEMAQATYFIEEHLGGILDLAVVIKVPAGADALDREVLAAAWDLQKMLEARSEVGHTMSVASYMAAMNNAFAGAYEVPATQQAVGQYFFLMEEGEDSFDVYSLIDEDRTRLKIDMRVHDVQREQLMGLVSAVREYWPTRAPAGVTVEVTGGTLMAKSVTGGIVRDLVESLLLAFGFIFLITVVLFRSIRLGLLSIVPNVLPLIVCMGIMGAFDIRLRVATAMIFAIALGIAVDDTIHFLNRYRVERAGGKGPRDAVETTLRTTGKAITQTSILLVIGLLSLMTGSFKATVHFSILAGTIFTTAMYAALMLLPAAIVRFGGKDDDKEI